MVVVGLGLLVGPTLACTALLPTAHQCHVTRPLALREVGGQGVACSGQFSCGTKGDSLLQAVAGVGTEHSCQALCATVDGCAFYTWYDHNSDLSLFCFLLSSCAEEECQGCHSGPAECPAPPSTTTPHPEDCEGLQGSPPQHGDLDCYISNQSGGEECHLLCHPGYATSGPSVVTCGERSGVELACEEAVALVTGGDQALQLTEVYSSTNSCSSALPSLPSLFTKHTVDYVDGQVLLCGGSTSGGLCVTLTPDLTWTKHSNLTTKRSQQASGVFRRSLSLLGGGDSSTETWEAATGWARGETLPQDVPIDACATRISPSEVLVVGGRLCPACTFVYSWLTGEWRRVGDLKEGRTSHGCTTYTSLEDGGLRVLVAGGWAAHNIRTSEVYNPATERWREVGDLTGPRRGLALVTVEGGRVVALGGRYSTALAAVDTFDTETEAWTAAPELLHQRAYLAATGVPQSMLRCYP